MLLLPTQGLSLFIGPVEGTWLANLCEAFLGEVSRVVNIQREKPKLLTFA